MPKIDDIIKDYRDIRTDLESRAKEFKAYEKSLKEELAILESEMLAISNELGVDSFKTEYGTAFKTKKSYARLDAGPEAKELRDEYARSTGDFGLYTAHVNKTHTKELLDAGVNMADIGILWLEEWAINFRKPSK